MYKLEERYICAYLCKKDQIDKFNTLINFYNEISNISLKTKDIKFMQFRLQWFMDAIQKLYKDEISGFPIVDNLLPIINKYNLAISDFSLMLEAKSIDKDYIPFESIEEYVTYCKNTGGILWKIIMQIYGGNKDDQEAAYYSGTVFAILGHIRNINFDIQRMHYKLIFNKNIVLKGNKAINIEIKNNILCLEKYIKNYIILTKKNNVTKKLRKLLLLNIFSKGYYKVINKYINKINLLDPYELPVISKLEFILKYIINKY